MAKKIKPAEPRRKTEDWETRERVARNVELRMNKMFEKSSNKTKALAEKAGLPLSRIQDVLKQHVGASIDTIGKIAKALQCGIHELFMDEQADEALEVAKLYLDTDDFGQTNILQNVRAWHKAQPKGKPHSSAE